MPNIAIISASVRTGRNSHRVALFFKQFIADNNLGDATIIDLNEYHFPVFEERLKNLEHPSAAILEFAEKIKTADGIIIVTPEYNGGYPAALKNVIDLLYAEWHRKPLAIATVSEGAFGGSQVILQALEQVGDVSFLTSGQVVAANGQPSPLQVANEFTYLASSSTVSNATTGNITTLTPATKTVGFTANFLPMILGDNRIMLQYQINLSSLLSLNNVSSGGSSIQTPNIATQSLQQQAFVRDGQSIVLFGYEQERAASNWARFFPGISKDSNSDRTVMVIIMEVYGGK